MRMRTRPSIESGGGQAPSPVHRGARTGEAPVPHWIASLRDRVSKRNSERDRRPAPGRAVDVQLSANALGALAHGGEAEARRLAARSRGLVESDAVVADDRHDLV